MIDGGASGDNNGFLQDAIQTAEKGISTLEKKLGSQIADLVKDMASLRVKTDGQCHRVASIAERLETSHEPALESLRTEMAQARAQDRRELEGELMVLRSRVQEATDGTDDAQGEVREALRQAHAEIAALTLRPDDKPTLRAFEERLGMNEREVMELRARLDSIPSGEAGLEHRDGEDDLPDDLEDMRRRIEWLEEQSTAGAVSEKADQRQVEQVQGTVCELLEQVSNIKQRQSSIEASGVANQQQLQNLQGLLERRSIDDSSSGRALAEFEAKVGAVSQQVVVLEARLLEVESGLEVARENEAIPGIEVSQVSMTSDGPPSFAKGLPPLPRGESDRGNTQQLVELQQQLEAMANQFEAMDELSERVIALEESTSKSGAPNSGDQASVGMVSGSLLESLREKVDRLSESLGAVIEVQDSQNLEEMKDLIEGATKRILKLEASGDAKSDSHTSKEVELRLDSLSDRIDAESLKHGKLEADFKAVCTKQEELSDSVSQLKVNAASSRDEVGLSKQVEDLEKNLAVCEQKCKEWSSGVDDLSKRVEVFQAKHEESTANVESIAVQLGDLQTNVTTLEKEKLLKLSEDFNGRTKALDERIDSYLSATSNSQPLAQVGLTDEEVKEQVQKVVAELREDLKTQQDAANRHYERYEKEVSDMISSKADLKVLRDSLDKAREDISEQISSIQDLRSEMDSTGSSLKKLQELPKKVEDVVADVGSCKDSVADFMARMASVEKLPSDLQSLRVEVKDLAELKDVKDDKPLSQRVKVLEDRLDSRPPASPSHSPSASGVAEERLRTQVQTTVEELRTQVLEELGSLAEHQSDLASAKASLQALAKRVGTSTANGESDGAAVNTKRFDDMEAAMERLRTDIRNLQDNSPPTDASADLFDLRKQLAEVQARVKEQPSPASGTVRKIGISNSMIDDPVSSPIALVRNKLDTLSEQVADLQSQVFKGSSSKTSTTAREVVKDNSLNFSLTEDQTTDSRIGGGSLNFSLTEQVEQDDDALAKIMSEGGRPRPPALSLEESQTLASVAEEQSGDIADDSAVKGSSADDSAAKDGGGSGSDKGSVGLPGQSRTAAVTPKSTKSSTGSPSREGVLEISQSANDVSVGFDISVEDSLQLEDECDHVENVKPNPKFVQAQGSRSGTSPDAAAGGNKTGVADSDSSDDEQSKDKVKDEKSNTKVPDEPMSRDALSAALRSTDVAVSKSSAVAPTSTALSSQPQEKDDDQYEDSFDDDMSVAESINESIESMGSDN